MSKPNVAFICIHNSCPVKLTKYLANCMQVMYLKTIPLCVFPAFFIEIYILIYNKI